MKIALVTENISKAMSGEALLANQFAEFLQERGIEIELVCHERVREDLLDFWRDPTLSNVHFVKESKLQSFLWKSTQWMPYRIRDLVINQTLHLMTQLRARSVVRKLVASESIDAVFEPAPIAPKGVSCMYDVGAPVIIGPMCGGLEFPPSFRFMDSAFSKVAVKAGRFTSAVLHRILPGKLKADTLIVANGCTQDALPRGYRGKVYHVVESGVDLAKFDVPLSPRDRTGPTRFAYSGRLVDWKGVQYLIDAFAKVAEQTDCELDVVGDGELMPLIRRKVEDFGIADQVHLHGWMKRSELPALMENCDCMVMPSLRECGGSAILEAMAMGIPLIGTAWAGPKDYIDASSGLLVEPSSPEGFVDGLANAMLQINADPEMRRRLGEGARQRVEENYFAWDSKTNRVIEILNETVSRYRANRNAGSQREGFELSPSPAS